MNHPNYGLHLSRFHGCHTFRRVGDMYVLDFQDMKWETWAASRIAQSDQISVKSQHTFLDALKTFCKTEAPCTIFCKGDSWTLLVGKERVIIPMPDEKSATIHLYVTPLFVDNPQIVSNHLQGMALPAYDNVFPYKNCILFLDSNDLPQPGGCYFDPIQPCAKCLYRICILTNEPPAKVNEIASEWKARRGVMTLPFLTKDVIKPPPMIHFQPIRELYFPDQSVLSSSTIQKRLSLTRPHCLLQDILGSYFRHHLRNHEGHDPETNPNDCLHHLGLVVEWPFRITYEGAKPTEIVDKRYVALAVNGERPTRLLQVRHPYDRYIEYDAVPATLWTRISYVQSVLETPPQVEKVSIKSTVIGFVYKNTFFCFNFPLLEGFPHPNVTRNMHYVLSHGKEDLLTDNNLLVSETFQLNDKYLLHHVQMNGIPFDAWCVTKVQDHQTTYPKKGNSSPLLEEWMRLFTLYTDEKVGEVIDTELIRLALVLTRHRICFNTRITDKKGLKNALELTDNQIVLHMGEEAAKFLNEARVQDTVVEEQESCIIM